MGDEFSAAVQDLKARRHRNLEMGGPASESFVMIRNAERRARQRAGQLARAQTSKSAKKKRATYEE